MSTPASEALMIGRINSARIVRMEMDWDSDFILQCLDQGMRREGAAKAGHIFDRQHVRTHLFELLCELHIVFQRILCALRIEDITGVADRRFANGVRVVDRFHRHFQVRRVIQRIEDSENVHAALSRMFDETSDNVVRII